MADSGLRIGVVTWRDLAHPDGGGSEVYVESLSRELVRRGHRVEIHCSSYAGAAADEVQEGVHLRRRGGRLTVYPRAWWWLLLRRHDVVIDVVNGLPFLAPLARPGRAVALVHHVHRQQWRMIYPGLRGRIGWWVEGRLTPALYRRVPFLTVSEHTAADLVGLGVARSHVTVARNGLAVRPEVHGHRGLHRLCVLARLVPHKQIEHCFEVLRRLRERFPDVTLDVIGDGWWRGPLEDAADRAGVRDLVTFHGHASDDDRDLLLASASTMVLPSVMEGWGLAVMEAAAQGTPTVAYESAGGIAESVVDGHTGLLARDLDGLEVAVSRLLEDQRLARSLGEAARTRAATFTWSATADRVEELLRAVAVSRRT